MNTQTKKLLLVEDSPADTALTKYKLEELFPDVEIISVDSVSEAYDAAKRNIFDLILLDLNLPDAFGASSVAEIKRFDNRSKIIVLTGFANDITKDKARQLGATDILAKADLNSDAFKRILGKYL